MTELCLGHGVLTWHAAERHSDRYGSVYLMPEGCNSLSSGIIPSLVDVDVAVTLAGRHGSLTAIVRLTRNSTHIGDLFRRLTPVTPEIGERILLGTGVLFFNEITEGGLVLGLRPTDGRAMAWLDPRALYRAHEQSVDLVFEEKPR